MVKENIKKLYLAMGMENQLPEAQTHEARSSESESTEPSGLDTDEAGYNSWLEKHPPALASFYPLMRSIDPRQVVVFLDYDGTLSPIVGDPDRAFMSDGMRSSVSKVAKYFPTAIISGRSRDKVYGFVKLDEVFYAGSHGMDIMGPRLSADLHAKYRANAQDDKENKLTLFQPAKEYLPSIHKMIKELKRRLSVVPGSQLEDNRFCISVHYRHVSDEDYSTLEGIVNSVLSDYPAFHITRGKKVLEIRPSIKWNKGHALEYLLHTLGFADSKPVFPIYLGDDKTDEDAFKVLRSKEKGLPVIVSSVPRETVATHSVRDPEEVMSFLLQLAKWGAEFS